MRKDKDKIADEREDDAWTGVTPEKGGKGLAGMPDTAGRGVVAESTRIERPVRVFDKIMPPTGKSETTQGDMPVFLSAEPSPSAGQLKPSERLNAFGDFIKQIGIFTRRAQTSGNAPQTKPQTSGNAPQTPPEAKPEADVVPPSGASAETSAPPLAKPPSTVAPDGEREPLPAPLPVVKPLPPTSGVPLPILPPEDKGGVERGEVERKSLTGVLGLLDETGDKTEGDKTAAPRPGGGHSLITPDAWKPVDGVTPEMVKNIRAANEKAAYALEKSAEELKGLRKELEDLELERRKSVRFKDGVGLVIKNSLGTVDIPLHSQAGYEESSRFNKKRDELQKAIGRHPALLATRKKRTEEIGDKITELKKYAEPFERSIWDQALPYSLGPVGGVAVNMYTESRESKNYSRARKLYEDAQKMLNAPLKFDNSNGGVNALKGGADKLSDVDFLTFGGTEILRNLEVKNVMEKVRANENGADIEDVLSRDEQMLLDAFFTYEEAAADRSGDLSLGYQVGGGAVEGLAIAAQALLTGGVGAIATNGAKIAMLKWMAKRLAGKALKQQVKQQTVNWLKREGYKGLAWMIHSAGKALVATPFTPGAYVDASRRMLEYERGEDGKPLLDEKGVPVLKSYRDAMCEAFMDAFIDNLAGESGIQRRGVVRAAKNGLSPEMKKRWIAKAKQMAQTKPGKMYAVLSANPVFKTFSKNIAGGITEAVADEFYAACLREAMGNPEALKDFTSVDALLVMLASVGTAGVVDKSLSQDSLRHGGERYAQSCRKLKKHILETGVSEQRADNLIRSLDGASVREISSRMTPLVNRLAHSDAGHAARLFASVSDYVKQRNALSVLFEKSRKGKKTPENNVLSPDGNRRSMENTPLSPVKIENERLAVPSPAPPVMEIIPSATTPKVERNAVSPVNPTPQNNPGEQRRMRRQYRRLMKRQPKKPWQSRRFVK